MPISFGEVPAIFEGLAARAERAAAPVALNMAETFADHVRNVTLRRFGAHSRWSKTPSPPDGPAPAMVSGHLADSMVAFPGASSGGVASAVAANSAIYAAVQNFGRDIEVKSRRFLMWKTDYITPNTNLAKSLRERDAGSLEDGLFLNFAKMVHIPERNFFEAGLEEILASGELERNKIAVFMSIVWGG